MRLDVIADCRRCDDAALCTILTQRVLEQLVPSDSSPASPANAQGSTYHPPADGGAGAQPHQSSIGHWPPQTTNLGVRSSNLFGRAKKNQAFLALTCLSENA